MSTNFLELTLCVRSRCLLFNELPKSSTYDADLGRSAAPLTVSMQIETQLGRQLNRKLMGSGFISAGLTQTYLPGGGGEGQIGCYMPVYTAIYQHVLIYADIYSASNGCVPRPTNGRGLPRGAGASHFIT